VPQVRPSVPGPKTVLSNAFIRKAQPLQQKVGASPIFFNPGTLGRTRPVSEGVSHSGITDRVTHVFLAFQIEAAEGRRRCPGRDAGRIPAISATCYGTHLRTKRGKIADTVKFQRNLMDKGFPVMDANKRTEKSVARFKPE
jgi:hypothetical protein